MSTTAWTASKDTLVRELAKARGERDAALKRLHALSGELQSRRLTPKGKSSEARERYRQEGEVEAMRWTAEAQRLLESGEVPPDPLAPGHRKTLIDALNKGAS